MTKNTIITLSLCLLLSFASHGAQLTEETLLQLDMKSGSIEQTRGIPESFLSPLDSWRSGSFLTDEIFGELSEGTHKLFNHEELTRTRRNGLLNAISEEDGTYILNWLNSDLGSRFTHAEVENDTVAAREKMYRNQTQLLSLEADKEFAKSMDEVLKSSEHEIQKGLEDLKIWYSLTSGTMPSDTIDVNVPEHKIELVTQLIEHDSLLWKIQTYQSFSSEEKAKYLAFLASDAYQKYHSAKLTATDLYMDKYVKAVATSFSEFLFKDTYQLMDKLLVSHPTGMDLTFKLDETSGTKKLIGWEGEESSFEFFTVTSIQGSFPSEDYWSAVLNVISDSLEDLKFEVIEGENIRGTWGANIEYQTIRPKQQDLNTLIYIRIFNDRINYLAGVSVFNRMKSEAIINQVLQIVTTAKILE